MCVSVTTYAVAENLRRPSGDSRQNVRRGKEPNNPRRLTRIDTVRRSRSPRDPVPRREPTASTREVEGIRSTFTFSSGMPDERTSLLSTAANEGGRCAGGDAGGRSRKGERAVALPQTNTVLSWFMRVRVLRYARARLQSRQVHDSGERSSAPPALQPARPTREQSTRSNVAHEHQRGPRLLIRRG